MANQNEIHRMALSESAEERREAVDLLSINFLVLPDKKQAWDDLDRLTSDEDSDVRTEAGYGIVGVFTHIPDKKQAWKDLIWLAQDIELNVGWSVADALGRVFIHIPDKKQAWDDLHRLTHDKCSFVRWEAVNALGSAFPHISDKHQVLDDMNHLAQDEDHTVRAFANYSLGRASIFKATEVESEDIFRKELEKALEFFENASKEETFFNPAKFCLPFYRSFYTITFKKEEAQAEVQKYLAEAKSAVAGSKNKEKLLDAVENLANALKEAQKARDFNTIKCDPNAYRRYCERAGELLDTAEEKAHGAAKLIRKGLPIIDERIREILAEIEEKTKNLCKQTKGTDFESLGINVYSAGQKLSNVRDPIGLEKNAEIMGITLYNLCKNLPDDQRSFACELLKKAHDEPYVEDKLNLYNNILNGLKSINYPNVSIVNSENVMVAVGNNNVQKWMR